MSLKLEQWQYPIGRYQPKQDFSAKEIQVAIAILKAFPTELKELLLQCSEQDYDQPCNCLKEAYKTIFSASQNLEVMPVEIFSDDDKLKMVNKLVHFGWKKEAIPITQVKKTLIAKFFDAIFG